MTYNFIIKLTSLLEAKQRLLDYLSHLLKSINKILGKNIPENIANVYSDEFQKLIVKKRLFGRRLGLLPAIEILIELNKQLSHYKDENGSTIDIGSEISKLGNNLFQIYSIMMGLVGREQDELNKLKIVLTQIEHREDVRKEWGESLAGFEDFMKLLEESLEEFWILLSELRKRGYLAESVKLRKDNRPKIKSSLLVLIEQKNFKKAMELVKSSRSQGLLTSQEFMMLSRLIDAVEHKNIAELERLIRSELFNKFFDERERRIFEEKLRELKKVTSIKAPTPPIPTAPEDRKITLEIKSPADGTEHTIGEPIENLRVIAKIGGMIVTIGYDKNFECEFELSWVLAGEGISGQTELRWEYNGIIDTDIFKANQTAKLKAILSCINPKKDFPSAGMIKEHEISIKLIPPEPTEPKLPEINYEKMPIEEKKLIAVVNKWWQEGAEHRQRLQNLMEEISLKATFCNFGEHVMREVLLPIIELVPHERGVFLWYDVPGTDEKLIVPADPKFFDSPDVIALIRMKMFDGIDVPLESTSLKRLYKACHLKPSGEVYMPISRGYLLLEGYPEPNIPLPPTYDELVGAVTKPEIISLTVKAIDENGNSIDDMPFFYIVDSQRIDGTPATIQLIKGTTIYVGFILPYAGEFQYEVNFFKFNKREFEDLSLEYENLSDTRIFLLSKGQWGLKKLPLLDVNTINKHKRFEYLKGDKIMLIIKGTIEGNAVISARYVKRSKVKIHTEIKDESSKIPTQLIETGALVYSNAYVLTSGTGMDAHVSQGHYITYLLDVNKIVYLEMKTVTNSFSMTFFSLGENNFDHDIIRLLKFTTIHFISPMKSKIGAGGLYYTDLKPGDYKLVAIVPGSKDVKDKKIKESSPISAVSIEDFHNLVKSMDYGVFILFAVEKVLLTTEGEVGEQPRIFIDESVTAKLYNKNGDEIKAELFYGAYVAEKVPPGYYKLVMEKPGCHEISLKVEIKAGLVTPAIIATSSFPVVTIPYANSFPDDAFYLEYGDLVFIHFIFLVDEDKLNTIALDLNADTDSIRYIYQPSLLMYISIKSSESKAFIIAGEKQLEMHRATNSYINQGMFVLNMFVSRIHNVKIVAYAPGYEEKIVDFNAAFFSYGDDIIIPLKKTKPSPPPQSQHPPIEELRRQLHEDVRWIEENIKPRTRKGRFEFE